MPDRPMSLRFVVLRHEGVPEPHYDLMFETHAGSKLTTWRSERWPIDRPTPLQQLGEHRRDYLEYEGPISRDRGFVQRVAAGTCMIERSADGSWWSIAIENELAATVNLRRVDGTQWLAVPACGE